MSDGRLEAVEKDIASLKNDVVTIRADLNAQTSQVSGLVSSIGELKGKFETEINGLRGQNKALGEKHTKDLAKIDNKQEEIIAMLGRFATVFGLDDKDGIKEASEVWRHARQNKTWWEKTKDKAWMVVLGIIVAGACGAAFEGFKTIIRNQHTVIERVEGK